KRLRDGTETPEDITLLEDYRTTFDPLLIETSAKVDCALARSGLPFVLSGRSKRTKSIIRKLQRLQNAGMDLSRMGDIVGIRVIIDSIKNQDAAIALLSRELVTKDVYDYRKQDRGYRSVHVLTRHEEKLLEIQIRTLPQHLWAIESEAFGEQVKEGTVA